MPSEFNPEEIERHTNHLRGTRWVTEADYDSLLSFSKYQQEEISAVLRRAESAESDMFVAEEKVESQQRRIAELEAALREVVSAGNDAHDRSVELEDICIDGDCTWKAALNLPIVRSLLSAKTEEE